MLMGRSGAPSRLDPASLDLLILLVEEKRVFFSRLAFALCFVHQLLERGALGSDAVQVFFFFFLIVLFLTV